MRDSHRFFSLLASAGAFSASSALVAVVYVIGVTTVVVTTVVVTTADMRLSFISFLLRATFAAPMALVGRVGLRHIDDTGEFDSDGCCRHDADYS